MCCVAQNRISVIFLGWEVLSASVLSERWGRNFPSASPCLGIFQSLKVCRLFHFLYGFDFLWMGLDAILAYDMPKKFNLFLIELTFPFFQSDTSSRKTLHAFLRRFVIFSSVFPKTTMHPWGTLLLRGHPQLAATVFGSVQRLNLF